VTIKYGPISDENLADAIKHHGAEDIDIHRMAEELRARRAADLTDGEVGLLVEAMGVLSREGLHATCGLIQRIAGEDRVRAALARVLGGGE
jgi:hypothetical protein